MFARIKLLLRERILTGELQPGAKLPSIAELSASHHVSAITVRRALNDLMMEGLVVGEQGKGTFVATPTPGAPSTTAANGTRLVGLLIPDLVQSPFFASILRGVGEILPEARLIVSDSNLDLAREAELLARFAREGISDVLWTPVTGARDAAADHTLSQTTGTIVCIDRHVPGLPFDRVSSDNVAVGRLAAEHLLSLGHRQIAFVYAHPCLTFDDRLNGFHHALAAHGIAPSPALVRGGWNSRHDYEEVGYLRTLELFHLNPRPTAMVAGNEAIAFGILRACRFLGVVVPQALSVVSVDDLQATLATPALTSIHQPTIEMGRMAARLLKERWLNRNGPPRSELLPVRLVVRDSTTAVAK